MVQSSLMVNRDLYIAYFANSYYDQYRKARYGVKSCRREGKIWLDTIRKQLIDYQDLDPSNDFCKSACTQVDPNNIVISYTQNGCL